MRRSARASTAPGASRCENASAATFDFELQASADDNGIVLSIGPQHSFPIEQLFDLLDSANGEARC